MTAGSAGGETASRIGVPEPGVPAMSAGENAPAIRAFAGCIWEPTAVPSSWASRARSAPCGGRCLVPDQRLVTSGWLVTGLRSAAALTDGGVATVFSVPAALLVGTVLYLVPAGLLWSPPARRLTGIPHPLPHPLPIPRRTMYVSVGLQATGASSLRAAKVDRLASTGVLTGPQLRDALLRLRREVLRPHAMCGSAGRAPIRSTGASWTALTPRTARGGSAWSTTTSRSCTSATVNPLTCSPRGRRRAVT